MPVHLFFQFLVGKKDFMKRLLLLRWLSIFMVGAAYARSFTILISGLMACSVYPLAVSSALCRSMWAIRWTTRAWSMPPGHCSRPAFPGYIQLGRDGDVLVVTVIERRPVSSIKIEGNKAISTEDLLKGLGKVGSGAGEIFLP